MDHFVEVYRRKAEAYQRMIAAEDVEGNLLPALQAVADFRGRRVVDLGSGTGRLPLLLATEGARVVGVDLHRAMLEESRRQRRRTGEQWSLVQADMQAVPLAGGCADVVTAGWAIGHFTAWYKEEWEVRVSQILRQMQRVAAPAGILIVLETLGTGRRQPAPPAPRLRRYYEYLESAWGFRRQEIRTDYQFATVEDAVAATEFFFGPALSEAIRANGWARVPEWTGVWSRPAQLP
ncbi:MAG TPA: methyltransferase domain-containing protein [Candidatus Sulfomarinibacteraceae bacterium]|nr:methyltransferase domain-containing protein [Candidatus Sulfomarinibacteraceae bacterium]